jgi:hypothetical protein
VWQDAVSPKRIIRFAESAPLHVLCHSGAAAAIFAVGAHDELVYHVVGTYQMDIQPDVAAYAVAPLRVHHTCMHLFNAVGSASYCKAYAWRL